MKILVALVLCSIQCIPLEGLQLAPFVPSLSSPTERAKFLQAVAAQGDAALIGRIHKTDPLAWASGDGWRATQGTTALHAAAKSRDALAVRALIALGASVTARDDMGRSPLHFTARSDDALGATVELLDAGAKVNDEAHEGVTPLMEALRHHAHETVATLLAAGADRTKLTTTGLSTITQAMGTARRDVQSWILGFSPLPDHRTTYRCSYWERNVATWFLGSPSNNLTDSLFRTNLHIHCGRHPQHSRHMMNAQDLFLRTPLHTAVMRNDKACVRELLKMGADREAVDWLKRTPLRIAQLCKFREIEGLLNSQAQL